MNITGNVSQSNNTMKIDVSSLRHEAAVQKSVDLKTGSTIQGSVVSITDTEEGKVANINIGDQVISAKLQDGMGLREGQVLNFAVRSNSKSTVTITPLFENTSADQSTLKALTAAGVEINNDSIHMVKEMMGAGLPINKDAILDMNKSLISYPNNSIQTMVEMKSLGIPINANNITQFESYKNYEHQVTSSMESIMGELPQAFNTLMAEGDTAKALNLYGDVLKLFGGEASEAKPMEAAAQNLEAESLQDESIPASGIAAEGESAAGTVKEGQTIPSSTAEGRVIFNSAPEGQAVTGSTADGQAVANLTPEGRIVPDSDAEGQAVSNRTQDGGSVLNNTAEGQAVSDSATKEQAVSDKTADGRAVSGSVGEDKSVLNTHSEGKVTGTFASESEVQDFALTTDKSSGIPGKGQNVTGNNIAEGVSPGKVPHQGKTIIISEEGFKNPNSPKAVSNAGTDVGNNIAGRTEARPLERSFVNNLKSLGISDEVIVKYDQNSKDENIQKALMKELSAAFERADLSRPEDSASWKKIFSSNDYNRLLKDSIESQWHLKPGDVEKKENIENLYQRLGNQVKNLANAINQNVGAESKLGQAANSLQNNLDFMNQLNQMFQYVQLPLQMSGQNVHGDLYVYRNKHRKMNEDGSVSAVLHLDMDNLGPVDVYVKLLDTKVTTNFYVADDSILDLINDNIHILNERLEKRGYTMNVSMKLHDDMDGQDAAVDEMLSVSKTEILSTNSFDARA